MMEGVPLSSTMYGINKILPPELLHTTDEGCSHYMLQSLKQRLQNHNVAGVTSIVNTIELLHQKMHCILSRNSERDIPPGSTRSGLLQDTLIVATERKGNLLRLLYITYTDTAIDQLEPVLEESGVSMEELQECLQLYLTMCEWFHANNP